MEQAAVGEGHGCCSGRTTRAADGLGHSRGVGLAAVLELSPGRWH